MHAELTALRRRLRVVGFHPTFSRYAKAEACFALVIWLNENVTKSGSGSNATYTPTYHFYMKDHLGSNRVVASAAGVAEQVNHLTIKYTLTKYY